MHNRVRVRLFFRPWQLDRYVHEPRESIALILDVRHGCLCFIDQHVFDFCEVVLKLLQFI